MHRIKQINYVVSPERGRHDADFSYYQNGFGDVKAVLSQSCHNPVTACHKN